MKKIVFIRHGDISCSGRYIGSTDLDLSEKGKRQAVERKKVISNLNPERVYSSPLKRCRTTALLLGLSTHEVVRDEVREIDFGRWEGKTFTEIANTDKNVLQQWIDNEMDFTFPSGESISAFRKRLIHFSKHLYEDDAESTLIVTHGGVIRHLVCILTNISVDRHIAFKIDYAKIASIDLYPEGGVITALNI